MPTELVMPKLSDTMKEGTIVRWLKAEGDAIAAGEVIAEIQSDKATIEFEAYSPGVLTRILVQSDQPVAVGTAICVMADEGEAASTAGAAQPAAKKEAPRKPSGPKKTTQDETKQRRPPKPPTPKEQDVQNQGVVEAAPPAVEPAPASAASALSEQAAALRRVKPAEGLARVKFGGRGVQMGLSPESARRVIEAAVAAASVKSSLKPER